MLNSALAEAAVYLFTLGLFSFVVAATALMRHEMLILACIPPVFVALIVGFIMLLYAVDAFGTVQAFAAVCAGIPLAWWAARRYVARDLLIAIYLGWALALVCSLVAFSFPDHT